VDKIVGGVIPKNYIPAIEKGVKETMNEGIIAGFPVVDVRVILDDGSFHVVDSSDIAFKIAGSLAFRKAAEMANPVILEPMMALEVSVPEEYTGDIIGDLNGRRGKIKGMKSKSQIQEISAVVPMAEILTYASDLKSKTQGKGTFTLSFSHFEEVPSYIQEKIIAQRKKEQEEEKKNG
jgi:elongation factor G